MAGGPVIHTRRAAAGTLRALRLSHLKSNPLCVDCREAGRLTAASEVHHILKVRDRPDMRLDPGNVMGLCQSCHSARTGRGE
jgi:5-methylcytosine-specific restriction protein A